MPLGHGSGSLTMTLVAYVAWPSMAVARTVNYQETIALWYGVPVRIAFTFIA